MNLNDTTTEVVYSGVIARREINDLGKPFYWELLRSTWVTQFGMGSHSGVYLGRGNSKTRYEAQRALLRAATDAGLVPTAQPGPGQFRFEFTRSKP